MGPIKWSGKKWEGSSWEKKRIAIQGKVKG